MKRFWVRFCWPVKIGMDPLTFMYGLRADLGFMHLRWYWWTMEQMENRLTCKVTNSNKQASRQDDAKERET